MSELQNIAILPGEKLHYAAEFHPHLILRHLSHGVIVTDRRFIVREPHTIFGLIPHGYSESSAPLDTISSFTAGKFIHTGHFRIGVICSVLALFMLFTSGLTGSGAVTFLVALILIAVAVYEFLVASQNGFHLHHFGGGSLRANAGRSEDAHVAAGKVVLNALLYPAARIPNGASVSLSPIAMPAPVPPSNGGYGANTGGYAMPHQYGPPAQQPTGNFPTGNPYRD